ncbi:MAG: hypothetical protein KGL13_06315 [Gammaproteobacteria bacterium]|nr:hypothetical protein [Gammaproteobacteria bacterium]MDE2346062.1 hypothetical protein [Gammaproteobacteria bacterium]
MAPKLDYLPVQIQQTEPGKSTISFVLTEIHINKSSPGNQLHAGTRQRIEQ